jgi:hypothetical protein
MKPTPYSRDGYVRWHGAAVTDDRSLLDRLEQFRVDIASRARPDLEFLHQLLTTMFTYTKNEYLHSRGQEVTYQTPLSEALRTDPSGPSLSRYDALFKSVPSILNKMWRKAEDGGPTVRLANLTQSMTDLIRTDVRTETLDGAQFLARRMNDLPNLLYNEQVREEYGKRVEVTSFEPEMKMASGYFAYHGLVRFKSGYTVEVQVYSALMSEWRKLSHFRLEPIAYYEFGSPESRLISLGHALHLAECEIVRLRQEIVKK